MLTDWKAVIGLVAGILALIAFIPYITSTLWGTTRPNKVTWWTWSVVQIFLTITFWQSSENHEAIWVSIGYTAGIILIAILSINYGHSSRLDLLSLMGIGATVLVWISIGSLGGLMTIIMIDVWASLPTIRKSKTDPKSESLASWVIGFFANTFNLLAITQWNEWAILYPVYLFVLTGSVSFLLISNKMFRSNR